jgi:RNA polymerase sigma-70 factor (ECF subfamily)
MYLADMDKSTQVFEQLRSRLLRLAYGMLGSRADAEDIVQEAFIKWSNVDHDAVKSDWAFLSTIVSRLCLDEIRSARKRREQYVGPWLPEPLVRMNDYTPEYVTERTEELTMALMVILESLTPVQRAVYVLHDLFSFDYHEISELIGKEEANCRKIAQRARSYVDSQRMLEIPDESEQLELLNTFIRAIEQGEIGQLKDLLTREAILYSDGGGKVTAARKPIYGNDKISRFLVGIVQKVSGQGKIQITSVNGKPGLLVWLDGKLNSIWSFNIDKDRIRNVYIVLNPDKLAYIDSQIS